MKLYLLRRLDRVDYDETGSGIVRASSPRKARLLMAELISDENAFGTSPWLNARTASCRELKQDGTEGVVLAAFRAG